MKAVLAAAVLLAVVGIVSWMVRIGRRDYRELRDDPDRSAPLGMVVRARLAGLLVAAPLLAFFWVDPPALTWIATIYLVVVIAVLGSVLIRRRNQTRSTGA